MDRVEPSTRLVLELPDLDVAPIRVGQRELEVAGLARRCHDVPLIFHSPFWRSKRNWRVRTAWLGCRSITGFVVVNTSGIELFDRSVGSLTTSNAMILSMLAKSRLFVGLLFCRIDPPADRILREVDDHLVALRRTGPKAPDRLGFRHQPAIGGDDGHRLAGIERQVPRPRDRRTEDAEAVLPALDLHHRPRSAVDQDHVAPQPGVVLEREQQRAVLVEQRIRQDQRHVVPTVRDRQRPLHCVEHVVLRDQPVIGVLGGVMDAVVVVPQRSSRLEVRVVVVLELPGWVMSLA